MGFLNWFRKKGDSTAAGNRNNIAGPTYLEGITQHISNPEGLQPYEWRRKIVTPGGNEKFRIKYYGQLWQEGQQLITGTDFAPLLVVAVSVENGQEIVLFDGCKHGYNALFCDAYSAAQRGRMADRWYVDEDGNDVFEIVIVIYYSIDYDDEYGELVDKEGFIELADGTRQPCALAKRDGFDSILLWGIVTSGKAIQIVSEELA